MLLERKGKLTMWKSKSSCLSLSLVGLGLIYRADFVQRITVYIESAYYIPHVFLNTYSVVYLRHTMIL